MALDRALHVIPMHHASIGGGTGLQDTTSARQINAPIRIRLVTRKLSQAHPHNKNCSCSANLFSHVSLRRCLLIDSNCHIHIHTRHALHIHRLGLKLLGRGVHELVVWCPSLAFGLRYVDSYLHAEKATLRKRAVQTDEVANAVAFLLSPRSSGINAQGLVIDAGMSINYFDESLVRPT